MDLVNSYFKKKSDKVTFIELKENTTVEIKGYPKEKQIPLPMMTDVLISEIKKGNLKEEINLSYIIDGIIYLIGIDPLFVHGKDYKNILMASREEIQDYIFYKAIQFIEKNNYDDGAVYFRTLKIINHENINGIFNYALALEQIAKKYFEKEKEEEGIEFLKASTRELETIMDIDDRYPLSYYKLGYHYKFFNQYLKAKLIWSKYLVLDRDELRLQEIRGELEEIENDVAIETGLTYLSREEFDKAVDIFLKLLPKFNKWWELKYLIGICYKGLGDFENAIEYLYDAMELNKSDLDVYNELGICLFTIGEIEKAIDVFTEGIENLEDEYKLLFNRGLGYLQLGKLEEAYEDIDNAWNLNPKDENIISQKQILDNLLNK